MTIAHPHKGADGGVMSSLPMSFILNAKLIYTLIPFIDMATIIEDDKPTYVEKTVRIEDSSTGWAVAVVVLVVVIIVGGYAWAHYHPGAAAAPAGSSTNVNVTVPPASGTSNTSTTPPPSATPSQ